MLEDNERLSVEGKNLVGENARLTAECTRLERQSAESDASAQRARIQFDTQQMTLSIMLGVNEHLLDRTEKLEASVQAEREAGQQERQKAESLSNELNETRKKHNTVVDEAAAFVRGLKTAVMLWETYKLRGLLLKKGAKIEQMQNDAQKAHAAESSALDMLRIAETWEKGHC